MRTLSLTAIIVFLLDQLSKLGVIRLLSIRERGEIEVLDPLLNFRWAENRGVNFGLFANNAEFMRWVLIAVAVAISAWVLVWLRREQAGPLVNDRGWAADRRRLGQCGGPDCLRLCRGFPDHVVLWL